MEAMTVEDCYNPANCAARRPVQIAAAFDRNDELLVVYSLCNDGSIWSFDSSAGRWYDLPPIPQGGLDDA